MGYIGAGLTRFNTADELTVTGDAEFDGNLTVKGTHITLDSATVQTVDLGDNDKIRLGDGDDLQIYHDGTNSIINEAGTGSLKFQYGGTDGVVFDSSGNVGIGTTSPSAVLDVKGSNINFASSENGILNVFSNDAAANDKGGSISLGGNSNSGAFGFALIKGAKEGTDSGYLAFGTRTAAAYSTERMRITSAGNVGIGSASPTSKLSVVSGTNAGITVNDGTVNTILFNTSSANGSVGTTTNHPMAFYANNAERMRIDSSGNVGIGTSSPSGVLHLTKGIRDLRFILESTPASGDMGVQLRAGSGDYIGIASDTGTGIVVDSSNNVGIGTSSPTKKVSTSIGLSDTDGYVLEYSGDAKGGILLNPVSGEVRMGALNSSGTYFTTLYANNSEAVRIDSSGNLLIGTTNAQYNSIGAPAALTAFNNGLRFGANFGASTTVSQYAVVFSNPNGQIGGINVGGTSTSYVTSSDYRLKTAVEYDWDATSRLKQLKPARFAWITDADTTVDGFLAHEVQDMVPEAISGTKDGMRDEEYQVSAATGDIYTPAVEATYDEDGVELTAAIDEVIHSADVEQPEELAGGQLWRETTAAVMGTRSVPDYQGIDQSKLVPLLVKTIQELEARIAALETA